MGTTQQYLARQGVTMEVSKDFLMNNYKDNLATVFNVCKQFDVNNDMIADILQNDIPGVTGEIVSTFFKYYGFDGESLEYYDSDDYLYDANHSSYTSIGDAGDLISTALEIELTEYWNNASISDSADDNDYYSFNAPRTGTFYAILDQLNSNLDLTLYDNVGNQLTKSELSGTSGDYISFNVTEGKSYSVGVETSDISEYYLGIHMFNQDYKDDFIWNPNISDWDNLTDAGDSISFATSVIDNTSSDTIEITAYASDNDYYSFTASLSGFFGIELDLGHF